MAKLEIPEWTGSTLTVAAFDNFASSALAAFVKEGFDKLYLQTIGPELQAAITRRAGDMRIGALLFSLELGLLGTTDDAVRILEKWRTEP